MIRVLKRTKEEVRDKPVEQRQRTSTKLRLRRADTCFAHLHIPAARSPIEPSKDVLPNRIGRFNGVRMQFVQC